MKSGSTAAGCPGSPPRGRGKDSGTVHGCGQLRITPAWAGKSWERTLPPSEPKDHPRMGGEKCGHQACPRVYVGSPPHGRGKDGESTGIGGADGITPAWAGKSCTALRRSARCGDHPRAGGEKISRIYFWVVVSGSPPRGRGKARHLSHGLLPCG